MIDFNYTAPELLPFRIQEVLDAPNEPHRIGGVVYVPEGGGECERESYDAGFESGVKATLQQLDGLIHDGADVDEIQGWIDSQWEEL